MKNADIQRIRKDFPLIENYDLAYLDNAATTQKPYTVIDVERKYYEYYNANPLRGLYSLSQIATEKYESARETVKNFINAKETREIIFTRNATESLNLIAYSLPQIILNEGDEILVSIMEHHSNFLPWQEAAKRKGAKIKYLECDKEGIISEQEILNKISDKTKILTITHISNILGRINDIKLISKICHENNIVLIVDGAQSVPHISVDVQDLDIDFLVFSGHKMFAPMGIGVLYGKSKWLEQMPPFLTGGEMIDSVKIDKVVYAPLPHKFEAGTVNVAGAIGLEEAIKYINKIGMKTIMKREEYLTEFLFNKIREIPHIKVVGGKEANEHCGIVTFIVEGVHPHDVSEILNNDKIAVRAGHHCAQPLLEHLGYRSTTRVSLAFYNTEEEIERFCQSLSTVRSVMGYE